MLPWIFLRFGLICYTFAFIPTVFASFSSSSKNDEGTLEEMSINLNQIYNNKQEITIEYYKKVVIAFCQAMNKKLHEKEFNPIPIPKSLWDFDETEKARRKRYSGYKKLLGHADSSVKMYWKVVIKHYDIYSIRVYFYKLLHWLQYHMRFNDQPNEILEASVREALNTKDDFGNKPTNILENIHIGTGEKFPPMRDVNSRIVGVKTSYELEFLDLEEDLVVEFCRKIVINNDQWGKDNRTIDPLVWNEKVAMPLYDKVIHYEDFLSEVKKYAADEFLEYFGIRVHEMLVFVYEAARVRLNKGLNYRIQFYGRTLDLKEIEKETETRRIRATMILFMQVAEKLIFVNRPSEVQVPSVFALENFPVEAPVENESLYSLKLEALKYISRKILLGYKWSHRTTVVFKPCYWKLRRWLATHFAKICPPNSFLYYACNVDFIEYGDIESDESDEESRKIYDNEDEDFYLKITTNDELIDLCSELT